MMPSVSYSLSKHLPDLRHHKGKLTIIPVPKMIEGVKGGSDFSSSSSPKGKSRISEHAFYKNENGSPKPTRWLSISIYFQKFSTMFLKHEGVENNDIIRKDLGIWMDFSEESLSKLPHLLYLGLLGLLQNKQTNTHTDKQKTRFICFVVRKDGSEVQIQSWGALPHLTWDS